MNSHQIPWQRPSRLSRGLLVGLGIYVILCVAVLTCVAVSRE
jgi:hypothetical protein